MKIRNTFVSTIVIGRFNPSILTPEFLRSQCDIELGEVEYITSKDMPVLTEFKWEERGISFFADLERFQMKETGVTDLREARGPEIVTKYLKKLEYTPIFACGINFNYLVVLTSEEVSSFNQYLNNEANFSQLCQTKEFQLETRKKYREDGPVINQLWMLTFYIKEGLKCALKLGLVKSDNAYEFNHNFEVPELRDNRENLQFITEELQKNVEYHEQMKEKLFGRFSNV